jgi:hypothetical protein
MSSREDPAASRRAQLEELVPGSGFRVQVDRGAWAALSQGSPGTWSWGRAALTIGLSLAVAAVVYLTVYRSIDWVIGLAVAYALLLWRARAVHGNYLRRGLGRSS